MSSIRLFILDSFERHGEMHGHQLRLLAEQEHVHLWTDISVGSLYGAIKRLVGEGLLAIGRAEREGNFPERQVYAITEEGRRSLASLRLNGLTTVVFRPDPFDLAVTRLDLERISELPLVLRARSSTLTALLDEVIAANQHAAPYLSIVESFALAHREQRIRAEIAWLSSVIAALPQIIENEIERAAENPVKGLSS